LKASRLLPAVLSRCQQVEIPIEPAHKLDFRAQRLKKKRPGNFDRAQA
jgi:hypothetical protein